MKLRTPSARSRSLALLATLAVVEASHATLYTWRDVNNTALNWSQSGNWTRGDGSTTAVPDPMDSNNELVFGADKDGFVQNDFSSSGTVFQLKSLSLTNRSWTLQQKDDSILLTPLSFTAGGSLNVSGGQSVIQGSSSFAGTLTVSVAAATDSLTTFGFFGDEASSLTKTGAGTLTTSFLLMDSLDLVGGTLAYRLASGGDFQVSGITFAGGTLDLGGLTETITSLVLGGSQATSGGAIVNGTLALEGNVVFQAGSGLFEPRTPTAQLSGNLSLTGGQHGFGTNQFANRDGSPYDVVLSGAISGAGGIDLTGASGLADNSRGVYALTGHSTYAGATNVDRGRLVLGVANALPTNTAVAVAAGATLDLSPSATRDGVTAGSYSQTVGSLAGAGAVNLGGAALTVGGAGTDTEFSGVLSGTGGRLVKTGNGTLVLSGTNAYTGGTTVAGGTLQLGSDGALGSKSPLTLVGGFVNLKGYSPSVGDLNLGDGTSKTVGAIGGSGTVNLSGNIVFKGAGDSGQTAPAEIDANFGLASGTHVLTNNGLFSSGRYDIVLNGTISGPGGLDLDGASEIVALTGANTYRGATTIDEGTLVVARTNALPTDTDVTVSTGARLSLTPGATQNGVTAGSYSQTVASLNGGGVVNLGSAILTVAGAGVSRSSGAIDGTGTLAHTGSGDLTLSGANAYSGGTTLSSGLTRTESSTALGTGAVTMSGNARLEVASDLSLASLSGRGTVGLANATLTVGGGDFDGNIGSTDANALVKVGDGTLTLTGDNTFTGGSTVTKGSLIVTGGSLVGDLNVAKDAAFRNLTGRTLDLGGGLLNGAVDTNRNARTVFGDRVSGAGKFTGSGTVEFDGGYSPGNGPASIAFESGLALGGANDLTMQLGGKTQGTGYDDLRIGGSASFGGTLDVVYYSGFMASAGQSFDLFDFAIESGTFSFVNLPTLASGLSWDASALYSTGVIRVVPQAVPEPAALAPLALAALALLRRRRK